MQYQFFIFPILLILITANYAHPSQNRIEREVSVSLNGEDDWLKELESQIISNPEDLKTFLSGSDDKQENPEGQVNYEVTELTEEPIVVTAKPYLTGVNSNEVISDEKVPEETTEKIQLSSSQEKTETGSSIDLEDPVPTSISPMNKNDARRLLDKILSNKRHPLQGTKFGSDDNPKLFRDDIIILRDGSEVKSFVELIKNQTHFIIVGCIFSLIVLLALILSVYKILEKLNKKTNITLIAHYEHDDIIDMNINECGIFQKKI